MHNLGIHQRISVSVRRDNPANRGFRLRWEHIFSLPRIGRKHEVVEQWL